MSQWPFADLLANGQRRVECSGRALGHISHLGRAQRTLPLRRCAQDVLAGEPHFATCDPAAAARITERGEPDSRFTRAGFADQPKHFSFSERDIDIVDQHLTVGRLDPQIAHSQDRVHAITPACPTARTDNSQSTIRLIPIVSSAIAAAGTSGAMPPKSITCALSRTMPPQSA